MNDKNNDNRNVAIKFPFETVWTSKCSGYIRTLIYRDEDYSLKGYLSDGFQLPNNKEWYYKSNEFCDEYD